jgi:ApaG protein
MNRWRISARKCSRPEDNGQLLELLWNGAAMYEATTKQIRISVTPEYLKDQSDPADARYFWSYRVSIENQGGGTVQLLTRHWRITDAKGVTVEVRGDGVVGKQPVLQPGQSFEYTSGTPLSTPSGIMVGSYNMRDDVGARFDVEVPAFSLDRPQDRRQLN